MKAQSIYIPEAGRIEIREEFVPDPGPDEVQVQSTANGICMFEVSIFNGAEPGYLGKKGGHEGVGIVTKVGKNVSTFREGDYTVCGQWSTIQNHDTNIAKLSLPPRDPATFLVEPVCCIVIALYSYDITPGDRVLVLGAGFMGLLNVQGLARYPLRDLVVADIKPANLELARKFGASETINSSTPEGQARLKELEEQPFDLVVECAGVPSTLASAGKLTRRGGRLAIFAWHHDPRSIDFGVWHMRGLKVLNSSPGIGVDHNVNAMQRAVWLLERGVFDLKELVTHRHQFADAQAAMELAVARPESYIKGVLEFS